LRACPQLEVLRPIIVFDSIAMMNVLSGQEIPAEHLLHDKNVFEDIPSLVRPGVSWRQDHHVPALVPCPATLPVAVGGSAVVTAGVTGGRMHLLPRSARTGVVDRQDGQRKWPLEGWNVRPHSAQTRLFMTSSYRNQVHVLH
jgi:hypothetical protein